jgi:hypothetical protein
MRVPPSFVAAAVERAERRSRGEDPFHSPPTKSAKKSGKSSASTREIARLLFDAHEHIRLGSDLSGLSRKDILKRLASEIQKVAP